MVAAPTPTEPIMAKRPTSTPSKAASKKSPKTKRAITIGGKPAAILTMLQRPSGATIADLQKATGWQPHSVRAALTGLRKQKHKITRSQSASGVTVYSAPKAS
jgi:hypothetical protein